jgi:hypothetical protein
VAEVDETNNTLNPNLTFTPVAPTTLPNKFLNPMGGVLFHDWVIGNYLDATLCR